MVLVGVGTFFAQAAATGFVGWTACLARVSATLIVAGALAARLKFPSEPS